MESTLRSVTVALVILTVVGSGPAVAQPADPPSMPDLPEQASETAKQVIDTVWSFLRDNTEKLGNALQNLLGGAQASGGGS